jgi:hypothetical protein
MSVLTPILDGRGYTRDSGSHGKRGYEGTDYRFNFFGATTPLSRRAWRVMGNVGNRLLFHEMRADDDSRRIIEDVVRGDDYTVRVERCRAIIHEYLEQIWTDLGGFEGVTWESEPAEPVLNALEYLMEVVRYARANTDDENVQPEGGHRIASALYDIARGRALLCGRREVTTEDLAVCVRLALSTMPVKRRPLIQALLNPANGGTLTASEVEALTGVSRPTAHERMKEVVALGFADWKQQDDGRNPKVVEVRPEYRWPDGLDFPEFGS